MLFRSWDAVSALYTRETFAKLMMLRYWQINAGIQAADSAIVSSDTRDTFQNVDTWLQAKRLEATKLTNATNGTNGTG